MNGRRKNLKLQREIKDMEKKRNVLRQNLFIEQDNIPYKFQPGSVNYELSYGLLGIRDYFSSLVSNHNFTGKSFRENASFCYKLIAAHEELLADRLLNYLNSKSNIKIFGETSSDKNIRVPTIYLNRSCNF